MDGVISLVRSVYMSNVLTAGFYSTEIFEIFPRAAKNGEQQNPLLAVYLLSASSYILSLANTRRHAGIRPCESFLH